MEAFLRLIPVSVHISSPNLYKALLDAVVSTDHEALFSFIEQNPSVLTETIDRAHYCFDFFFDCAVHGCMHPKHEEAWFSALYNFIELLDTLPNSDTVATIKASKYYILFCQKDSRNMYELFNFLYDNDFEVEPIETLALSLVARGEIPKLQRISENYTFDDDAYKTMVCTALRYGRADMLMYLMSEHEVNLNECGNILTFEHYNTDDQRFMFYRKRICDVREVDNVMTYGPIHSVTQNYVACLDTVLKVTDPAVTVETLDVWCSFMSKKVYSWDAVPVDVLHRLKEQLVAPIPLDHDFGQFTPELLGHTLGDRGHLVQDYIKLQERFEELQESFQQLLYNHRRMQEKYTALRHAKPVVRRRVRCITE